jgi:hypothetical protein
MFHLMRSTYREGGNTVETKKFFTTLVFLVFAFGPGLAAAADHMNAGAPPHEKGKASARSDVLYTCNCGAECKCNSASTKPGNCKCGKPMAWGHVIRIEGDQAVLCMCGEGCQCKGLDPKDSTKCNCGTPVKKVSLKGTGVYFCNCGGSCECNNVSDKPGKCNCGMDLKRVD